MLSYRFYCLTTKQRDVDNCVFKAGNLGVNIGGSLASELQLRMAAAVIIAV